MRVWQKPSNSSRHHTYPSIPTPCLGCCKVAAAWFTLTLSFWSLALVKQYVHTFAESIYVCSFLGLALELSDLDDLLNRLKQITGDDYCLKPIAALVQSTKNLYSVEMGRDYSSWCFSMKSKMASDCKNLDQLQASCLRLTVSPNNQVTGHGMPGRCKWLTALSTWTVRLEHAEVM